MTQIKTDTRPYQYWWLHDGAWYQNVAKSFGFEAANRLNQDCLRYMAKRAMGNYLRTNKVDLTQIRDLESMIPHFMAGPNELWPEGWCEMTATITGPDTFEVRLSKNFAIEMLKKAGTLEHYDCPGLAIREGWFAGLKITEYEQDEPECMCRGDEACVFTARVKFPAAHEGE